jgi:alpha-tubulin suppressor-like RCC1 family protein
MLIKPLKNLAPLSLAELEIPGRSEPLLPSGEWGINRAAALDNFPDKGLKVHLPKWMNMDKGDKVELLLNGSAVDQHTISEDTEVGQRVTLWIAPGRLQTGTYSLAYRVTRLSQAPETSTPSINLYIKLELPGGQDLNPEPGAHSELFMFIEPEIVNGIVDKETAADGVPIVIRAKSGTGIPYPDAAVGDVIFLSWGGVFQESAPLTAPQISDPANNPIEILITEETILEAGDTDNSGLAVTFRVRDKVNNYSEDWCKESRIQVSTGTNLLSPPAVKEALNNVLDLDTLGDENITVHVWATAPQFKLNDTLILKMRGITQGGDTVEVAAPSMPVDNLPHAYDLILLNTDVRKLAKTQVIFSYELLRDGSSDPLRSKGQFVQVKGEPRRLAAPIAEDEQQGALDPDLPSTRIRIPFDPIIEVGMVIELKWFGTRPNGSTYDPELEWFFPDSDEAENPAGFFIPVEGKHLKTLEGGKLDLSYNLLSDEDGTIVSRGSRHAAPLNVGEPQFELVKPIVLGEKNGALEPKDLPNGASNLTAPRPTAIPTKARDVVTYTWLGEVTGKKEDSITLNALSADRDVNFTFSAAFVAEHIEPNRGEKVTASYRILRFETGKTSYSNPLSMVIGEAVGELLPPAQVLQAIDDVLDPDNAPATVRIQANRPENAGDHFYLRWAISDGVTVYEDDLSISGSMRGKPVEFTVSRDTVLACLNKTVNISYRVELFEGGESIGEDYSLRVEQQQFTLPVATFREASGAQKDLLNPEDVYPNGATVVIAATAQLHTDDEVIVTVTGKATTHYPHTVLSTEQGQELSSIKVPHSVIDANDGLSISLNYVVHRKAGGTDGPSNPTVYDVRKVIGSGTLKVMGARYNRSTYRASSASRVLSAFNATTGQPIQAQWKYPADTQWTTATTWRDSQPQEPLQVRTVDDQLTLNQANIVGNGIDTTVTGQAAFVAHRDVGDVVGWGNAAYGANIPSTIITMDDIVEVSCTRSAYAARRANSAVVVWGTTTEGGNMGAIDPLGFVQVAGNATAFAGIKSSGSVVAWGTATDGATVPAPIAALTDIQQVIAAGQAFAALRANGQVVAWGLAANGATVPPDIGGFTDIKTLLGSFGAFAAHRANGRIVGWGHATYGGAVPAAIAALTDITELSCANAQAFTARRATGQVVAWGTAAYGGTIDSLIGGLTDIVEVSSTWRAFAARRGNGHVVAWGREAEGGAVPADIASLDDVVQVCGSSMAFAALRKNGTVVAWGDVTVGGDTAPVVDQLTNVVAIYDNTHGFCALTSDGRVVTWGQAAGGGDSSAVQDRLNGKVSHRATPASRGRALKASRQLQIAE